ncbi:hypothetical protein ACGFZP_24245 [Kitasatospora sp. NPDC048239]|uniref:hypothetical protein n=1 Tax=Kitasatospora sp. NPDC048239 TaxID=3364046 RepID=UPI003716F025
MKPLQWAHCITQLAGYKRPTHFIPLVELPRNTSGKLLRRPFRERAEVLVLGRSAES